MAWYVYVLAEASFPGDTSGPYTKIGYSMHAPEDSRLFNLSQGNPRTLVLEALYAFETADEARHAEKEVKRAFLAFLVRGEWFRVAWEDVHAWFMRAYPEMYPTA